VIGAPIRTAASALPTKRQASLENVTGDCSNKAADSGLHAGRDVVPRMAFLRHPCKNVRNGVVENQHESHDVAVS
jgi:hypothetical protein